MVYEFYSGSYAERNQDGIVKFRLDTDRGVMEKLSAYQGIHRPSCLAWNASRTLIYAVEEESPLGTLHVLKSGEKELTLLKSLSTEGANPCHISLDAQRRRLFVSNYGSGSLAVFSLDENGAPISLDEQIRHQAGADQTNSHISSVNCHMNRIYAADFGLSRIFVYGFNFYTRKLTETNRYIQLPVDSGPRQTEFYDETAKIIYIVCGLTNQVSVWEDDGNGYVLKQTLSTVPYTFTGENTAAAIKKSGNLLFVSNRGHDSIAVFRVRRGGTLEPIQTAPAGGKTPGDFAVFGNYMAIANQDSNTITVLKINRENGELSDIGIRITTVRPSGILPC